MREDPSSSEPPGQHSTGNGRFASHAVLAKFAWAVRSEPGPVRPHNEDYAGVFAPTTPDDAWDRGPLFVVADGLGGHAAGEVASRVAVEAALGTWAAPSPPAPLQALRAAVRDANVAVFDAALEGGRRGMGTTVVAATLAGREAIIAHVGDSRAYLVRARTCTQLTTDHSRVTEMVRMRLITPEMAAVHPGRSMLTRSLGGEPSVQIDLSRHQLDKGDVLLLCTDGLWDLVERRELAETAAAIGSPELATPAAAADRLVELVLERGAPDNATVAVIRISTSQPIPSSSGGRRSLLRRRR